MGRVPRMRGWGPILRRDAAAQEARGLREHRRPVSRRRGADRLRFLGRVRPGRGTLTANLGPTRDATAPYSKLGANAILGVSLAVARAGALACGLPLFRSSATWAGPRAH